jgi:deoxycytidylate deaminase
VSATSPQEPSKDVPRQSHNELVFALVGPIGTDLDAVTREITRELKVYAYSTIAVRLSAFLDQLSWPVARTIPRKPYDERVWTAMDAGDDLRDHWQRGDALALLAISAMETDRANQAGGVESVDHLGPPTLDRHAWVLRSMKTPAEVATLRDVYGPRLFVVAAHADEDRRVKNLRVAISKDRHAEPEAEWAHAPSQLIDRDWKEELAGGQNVSGTFSRADFFVDANSTKSLRRDVRRMLRIMFGDPYCTPTRDEYAMFQAAGAARRSVELGRQVGAAIVDDDGSVLALGTNEVPRGGGGSYWAHHADDAREFHNPKETNRVYQERIAAAVETVVGRRFDAAAGAAKLKSSKARQRLRSALMSELPQELLKEGGVGELTEFGRATHAEMSALLDAARRGVAVRGGTVMTTTFPCHNCARHIVEAGMKRVVFVEPYAKSLAMELHADSMELAARPGTSAAEHPVIFEPFVGVAPIRYLELFDAGWREAKEYPRRKSPEGETIDFEQLQSHAAPVIADVEAELLQPSIPVYRARERRAIDLLQEILEKSGFEYGGSNE